MEPVADKLFNYLRDVIYDPANAVLDVEELPEEYQEFGSGLRFFAECVIESKELAQALSKGRLDVKVPPADNEIAAPLKSLHASLRHLTWQAQQIAEGDYQQRVNFMGDFATAFNSMAQQLEERRKLDTQERSKLQQYINLILANTPNILLAFDTDGKAVFASKSYMRQSIGHSMSEIQGKTFAELFSHLSAEDFLQRVDSLFYQVRANKEITKIEQELDFNQDGNLRNYIIHIAPMLYEDETDMGTIVVFDDMTDIIQAQHKAEQARREAEIAQREAEKAREIAEKASRAKTDFLARMSHEMRTPMNAIMGMADIGIKTEDNDRRKYCFENITEASQHLLRVINDILDISEFEADNFLLTYSEFDFGNMLDTVIDALRIRANEKHQKLTTDIDRDLPLRIISDEKRLTQALTGLLSNAVKFTPEQGSLSLAVKKTGETDGYCKVLFTITDTGIGISKKQQENLFIPFEQADGSASRKFEGAGLGLAISKRIIEMMSGSIRVESEFGKGSSFIFEIKVKTGAAADTENLSDDGIFTGKRILIAEDVDINREIIAALLEETGLEIVFAFNGAEAVEKFIAAPKNYDLIFMDIRMPEMDGYEATKLIRASGVQGGAKIPIIAMTANVSRSDIEACLAAGMNAHLGKPLDIDKVLETLRQYLEPS